MSQFKTIHCPAGVNLLDYLGRNGIELPAFCDGNGVCGRCRIRVTVGTLLVTQSDASFLSSEMLRQGWRLACRAVTTEPVTVEVEIPEIPDVSHVSKAASHRYGAAISRESIALLDLTSPTVVDTADCSGDQMKALNTLLAKYPDVKNNLQLIVTTEVFDIAYPGANVVVSRSGDTASDAISFENAIMEVFQIGRQSDNVLGI